VDQILQQPANTPPEIETAGHSTEILAQSPQTPFSFPGKSVSIHTDHPSLRWAPNMQATLSTPEVRPPVLKGSLIRGFSASSAWRNQVHHIELITKLISGFLPIEVELFHTSQPITLAKVTRPTVSSCDASKRTLRRRSDELNQHRLTASGGQGWCNYEMSWSPCQQDTFSRHGVQDRDPRDNKPCPEVKPKPAMEVW
jgi:hypothetical protein